jgi:transposase InsO family protein/transposase-like protein
MYSLEDRKRAIELYIKYDLSAADTVRELGYPDRKSLKLWHKEYVETGGLHDGYRKSYSKYTAEQKKAAVDYYLEHGRSLSRTVRAMGYPTKEALRTWVDDLAPEFRKIRASVPEVSYEEKKEAVIDLCARKSVARVVAEEYGVNRDTLYRWKYELLGKEEMPMRLDDDEMLTDDPKVLLAQVKALREETETLKREKYRARMEVDILMATAELIKKDPGVNPVNLTNKEKTILIDALRMTYPLNNLLSCLEMPKSSYYYQREVLQTPDKYADVRERVNELFCASNGVYGYRRIHGDLANEGIILSEKVVRRIMAEDGLKVLTKRRRKYSSYKGDIGEEVENLVNRNFHADNPNELWLTDLTEFHIPAGKVYLSPILDCYDGMLVSWTISTSPNAELVNTMLDIAIDTLEEGEHPVVHHDRGCHYQWPGWLARIDEASLINSMSAKGCSPDNAACEGLFGRIKNEMFYYRSWKGVSIEEFVNILDSYLHWYNGKRIKQSLGYLSPVEYRQSLGLAA